MRVRSFLTALFFACMIMLPRALPSLAASFTPTKELAKATSKAHTISVSKGQSQQSDLPLPSWWSGVCDTNNYENSPDNPNHLPAYPLPLNGKPANYRGVVACGPRPYGDNGPDVPVNFFSGAYSVLEWECVELSMRYMYLAYGIAPYSADGKDVVWNYQTYNPNNPILQPISNPTNGMEPQPGDILSYAGTKKFPTGHTSVVMNTNYSSPGNGKIKVLEENFSSTGAQTLTMTNWTISGGVSGWLHHIIEPIPQSALPNTKVKLNGTGFAPGEQITITFDTQVVGTTKANKTGSFSTTFIVPGTAQPGTNTVQATGSKTGLSPKTVFYVPKAGHFELSPSSVNVSTVSGQNPSPQTLIMTNGGNDTLNWTLTSPLPSWLTVDPTTGSLTPGQSENITLTFSLPTTPGTYSTTLAFSDPNADNSPAMVPVTATVVGWAIVPSPSVTSGSLSGVAEVSPTDIWAVGGPLTEHWDGNSWTIVPNQGINGISFHGVTAIASNNVWAVGSYYGNGAHQTLIENWNGSSWSIIPSPNNSTRDNYLYSVTGVFANDIWAVGQYIPDAGGADQPLIEHWDGNSWTIVSGPDVGSGNDSSLESISYLLPNDIWAVGFTTNGYPYFNWTPLTEHYDGTSWHIVPSPTVNPANPWRLEGVTMLSSNDVWAVGAVYNNPPPSPVPDLIEHWDGNSWTIIQSTTIGNYDALFSVSGTGASDIWAVGFYVDPTGNEHTLIKHWDGSNWSIVPSPDGGAYRNYLSSVVAVSSTDVWAVGFDQDNINSPNQPLILRYH